MTSERCHPRVLPAKYGRRDAKWLQFVWVKLVRTAVRLLQSAWGDPQMYITFPPHNMNVSISVSYKAVHTWQKIKNHQWQSKGKLDSLSKFPHITKDLFFHKHTQTHSPPHWEAGCDLQLQHRQPLHVPGMCGAGGGAEECRCLLSLSLRTR